MAGKENPVGDVISFTADQENKSATATVKNSFGARLPETGGMGTTLFTMIGALLSIFAAAMLVSAGCGSGAGVTDDTASDRKPANSAKSDESKDGFDENSKDVKKKTAEIEQYIDKLYYFDIDDEKREESYYDGLMEGLDDRYSVYYTKDEYEKLMEDC